MGYVNTPAGQFNGVVPDANEDPNLAFDLLAITKAIEKRVVGFYANPAARDAATTAAGLGEGAVAYTADANLLWYHDGAAWQQFPPRQTKIASGPTVPSNADANYINGDVFFKV